MTAEEDILPLPLPLDSTDEQRQQHYRLLEQRIKLLISGEKDLTAVLATIACELQHAFEYYHWTGFYQVCRASKSSLVVGPYQGSHGCLRIPIGKGVCGMAALERKTQLVQDVHQFPGHIACASSTMSELVVPYFTWGGELLGVLDVDSDHVAAFRNVDSKGLEALCIIFKAWNAFWENVSQ